MALHLDNTIKQGHKQIHWAYTLSKGTPIHIGLENRDDTLEPEPWWWWSAPSKRGFAPGTPS